MSQLTDEFVISNTPEETSKCCRQAIVSIGWNIKSLEPHRIVPKVGVGLTRWPSKIEILLRSGGDTGTIVSLNGSIGGVGPLQKSHLRGEMNRLRNAIVVAASAPAPTLAARNAASELERLAGLHAQGALTDQEFVEAKRKVLSG